MPGKHAPLEVRFLAKFVEGTPDVCWEWLGAKINKHRKWQYGVFRDGERRRNILAHRFAYERHHGVVLPKGTSIVIMHTCDNPGCVNPAHLRLGTLRDNARDMTAKGRNRYILPARRGIHIGTANKKAVLTEELVILYRRLIAEGKPIRQLAREIGVSPGTLAFMRDRKTWKHVP